MALQALAKYGAATYSPEGSTTVTVKSLGGLNKEFTVDQSNRLLYQEERLSEVPGEYTVTAQGQSCVLAQVPSPWHHQQLFTLLSVCSSKLCFTRFQFMVY